MKKIILLICFAAFVSCKLDKKEEQIMPDKNLIITNNDIDGKLYFEVIMDVVVLKDDKFHLFYKDFNDNGYSDQRVIEAVVKGSEDNQQIVYAIPEEIMPIGLRLDFGINYNQEPIKLNKLKLRFDKKEFEFNDGKFEQLFRPNKFVSYDVENHKIVAEPIDGFYDPNFVSINLEDIVFSLID